MNLGITYGRNHTCYLNFCCFKSIFLMLRCPNCKTLKSVVSQKKMKGMDEDGREQINCKACNHSWKQLPLGGGGADGCFGGGD